jgi:tRNA G10  N-methylase Trm11
MKYFFVFGSQPTLSLAEVLNVLDLKKIDFSLKIFKKNFLILKTKEKLNEDELQKRLGGTVKIGIIFLN